MPDLGYLAVTAAFFALMLTYVRGCAALGRSAGEASAGAARDDAPGA